MTIAEIISGLEFTIAMISYDPNTGEEPPEPRNDMDKITIDACKGAIKALEQTRWIPCAERLPEDYEDVLVCDGVDMFVGWCEFDGTSKKWHSLDDNFEYDMPIIAWMPLPEPYKAETKIEQGLNFADQDTMMPAT